MRKLGEMSKYRERISSEFAAPLLAKTAERINNETDENEKNKLLSKFSIITKERPYLVNADLAKANYIPYYYELPILLDLSGLTIREWYSLCNVKISEPKGDMAELYAVLKRQNDTLLTEIRDWAIFMAPNVWRQFDRRFHKYVFQQVTYKVKMFARGYNCTYGRTVGGYLTQTFSEDIVRLLSDRCATVTLPTSKVPEVCEELGASLYWILGLDDPSFSSLGNDETDRFTIFADKRIQEEIVKLYTFMSKSDKQLFLETVKCCDGCLNHNSNEWGVW